MEFGKSSIEKKLQDYKLLKAKYERQEKALIDDSVFRKKSLERISSPEQINDYIRVKKSAQVP